MVTSIGDTNSIGDISYKQFVLALVTKDDIMELDLFAGRYNVHNHWL